MTVDPQARHPQTSMSGFGPNEWLVDELYQAYLADPESVDKAWWDFFADYQPSDMSLPRAVPAPARDAEPGPGEPRPAAPAESPAHARPPTDETGQPAGSEPPAPMQPAPGALTPEPTATAAPTLPSAAVSAPVLSAGGSETSPLRGPAARVVTNMESSLAVPTATSVRAVPAKLLIDNRVVINNHLSRSRGGKVSFTHIIGWAVDPSRRGAAGDELRPTPRSTASPAW